MPEQNGGGGTGGAGPPPDGIGAGIGEFIGMFIGANDTASGSGRGGGGPLPAEGAGLLACLFFSPTQTCFSTTVLHHNKVTD